jgi:hypothetical protein
MPIVNRSGTSGRVDTFAIQGSFDQSDLIDTAKTRAETGVDASEVAELERLLARLRSKAQADASKPITVWAASSSEDVSNAEDTLSEPSARIAGRLARERGSAGQAPAVRWRARTKTDRTEMGKGRAPGARGRASGRSAKVLWDTSAGRTGTNPLFFAQQDKRSGLMAEMLERYARLREQAAEFPSPSRSPAAPIESEPRRPPVTGASCTDSHASSEPSCSPAAPSDESMSDDSAAGELWPHVGDSGSAEEQPSVSDVAARAMPLRRADHTAPPHHLRAAPAPPAHKPGVAAAASQPVHNEHYRLSLARVQEAVQRVRTRMQEEQHGGPHAQWPSAAGMPPLDPRGDSGGADAAHSRVRSPAAGTFTGVAASSQAHVELPPPAAEGGGSWRLVEAEAAAAVAEAAAGSAEGAVHLMARQLRVAQRTIGTLMAKVCELEAREAELHRLTRDQAAQLERPSLPSPLRPRPVPAPSTTAPLARPARPSAPCAFAEQFCTRPSSASAQGSRASVRSVLAPHSGRTRRC